MEASTVKLKRPVNWRLHGVAKSKQKQAESQEWHFYSYELQCHCCGSGGCSYIYLHMRKNTADDNQDFQVLYLLIRRHGSEKGDVFSDRKRILNALYLFFVSKNKLHEYFGFIKFKEWYYYANVCDQEGEVVYNHFKITTLMALLKHWSRCLYS